MELVRRLPKCFIGFQGIIRLINCVGWSKDEGRGEEEEERRMREEDRGNFGIFQWSTESMGIFVHSPQLLLTHPPVWPINSAT